MLDTFWSTWEAFAGAGSHRETIERAVGYGHDRYHRRHRRRPGRYPLGLDPCPRGIPREWLRALRGKEVVEPLMRS